ncbi:MAG: phosphoribosylaminoimidazolesuccinocarboxamide synthase [Bacteroidetes bacterium GWA2_42_15]|nr:MAG: phosphoribosylaminoimidazolesuccinocarboxamide synthase [Bacteroidetes bacterium GWA2_42_15]
MQFGKKLYEGKTKVVYGHPEDSSLSILFFKDDITAGDGAKHDILKGKGKYDWETTRNCFELLNRNGIPSHFVSAPEENYLIVKKLKMIPLECVTRKIAAGSLLKRLPFREGAVFNPLLFELFLKDDSLHDPFVNEDHVIALKVATSEELSEIKKTSLKVFEVISSAFSRQDITLVDLKIEFGRDENRNLFLADDITNNSWRIWPKGKKENMLDKQLYRDGKVGLDAVLEGFRRAAEISGKF